MSYIWKVKAPPEHWNILTSNATILIEKTTLPHAYLRPINKNVKYKWEGTMQKYHKFKTNSKIPIR